MSKRKTSRSEEQRSHRRASRPFGHTQFAAFVVKEWKQIFRDPLTLLILLAMPITEMLLFGFAMNMDVSDVRTVIVDLSADRAGERLAQAVRGNPTFTYEGTLYDTAEAEARLRASEVDLAIVLPADFEEQMARGIPTSIQIIADVTDPAMGSIRGGYAQQFVADFLARSSGAEGPIPYSIEVNTQMLYNPGLVSAFNFVPGLMGLVLIVICTTMTSISIAREKEQGSMELLLTSPVRPTTIVLSKTAPYLAVSALIIGVILLISRLILGVPIRGSLLLIFGVTLLFTFLSLAFGLLISSLVKSQRESTILTGFGVMMPTMLLSGMIFPVENMPLLLQWVSRAVPATYYISSMRKLMIQGAGLSAIWVEVTMLLLFALVIIALAIRNVKPRLR